jgi:uncharacterized protein with beta-barrel porin domain
MAFTSRELSLLDGNYSKPWCPVSATRGKRRKTHGLQSSVYSQREYSWNESLLTGLFGGYKGTEANYANSGRTQSNAFRFGIYGSYSTGGFYSNAIVGAAFTGYDVDRPIEWTGFERDAVSKPTGGEFFSLLALGYDWTLGNFTFGPSVSAQYTYLGVGTFTESGADSLNLRVSSYDTNSFRSYIGGRVAYT